MAKIISMKTAFAVCTASVCMFQAACKPSESVDPNATGADTAVSEPAASLQPARSDGTAIIDAEAAAPAVLTTGGAAAAIKAAYGDDWMSNAEIPASSLETRFGLTPDMYEEVAAYEPLASVHNDKIIIVRARDGRLDDVVTALETAREAFLGSMQYPQNAEKNEASKVVFRDDFAAFILAGNVPDEVSDKNERVRIAEEQNKIGVDAFFNYISAND